MKTKMKIKTSCLSHYLYPNYGFSCSFFPTACDLKKPKEQLLPPPTQLLRALNWKKICNGKNEIMAALSYTQITLVDNACLILTFRLIEGFVFGGSVWEHTVPISVWSTVRLEIQPVHCMYPQIPSGYRSLLSELPAQAHQIINNYSDIVNRFWNWFSNFVLLWVQ